MTTDFRALCADLLRELDHASAWDYQQALKDQARAALAEPQPAADVVARPIPVSERLPEAGDCDADGRCWMRSKVEGDWRLVSATNPDVPHLKYFFTHWLPFNALPMPKEVE